MERNHPPLLPLGQDNRGQVAVLLIFQIFRRPLCPVHCAIDTVAFQHDILDPARRRGLHILQGLVLVVDGCQRHLKMSIFAGMECRF